MFKRSDIAGFALLVVPIIAVSLYIPFASSNDLFATWMAGVMFDAGQFDQIYNTSEGSFAMLAPPSWAAIAAEHVPRMTELYPYLYPPLWAALASLTASWDFETIAKTTLYLNITLIMGTIALAYRSAHHTLSLPVFVATALPLVLVTLIGLTALWGGQPQILVGFLIMLSIERAQRGALIAAGIAMALAAALKLYPALFALFFLAMGQRRAFVSFAVAGASLAALSIATAGWPLHVIFLKNIGQISDTVLITRGTLNPEATLAQLFFGDHLRQVFATETSGGGANWSILTKTTLWSLTSKLALVALLAGLWLQFRSKGAAMWPAAVTLLSMMTPVAWVYYFIPTAAFAPLLMHRLGVPRGALIILAFFAAQTFLTTAFYPRDNPLLLIDQMVRTAGMAGLGLVFWITARKAPT
ncbi:glycosyltransferase 87 family protein [Algirhabdus cladophorae]|uniref:glycosyltransferase 87 family protein n=1 Tax=Algirhabdus cladophorae TaxID=3377108 RepID=UPI003B846025